MMKQKKLLAEADIGLGVISFWIIFPNHTFGIFGVYRTHLITARENLEHNSVES